MASGDLWPAQEDQFPCEFPYEWSSPCADSTQTECQDYVAGLAERVAHSMLDDGGEDGNTPDDEALEPKNGVHCLEQDLWPALELKNRVHCLGRDLWPAMEPKNGGHCLEQDRWPAMEPKNGVHCLEQDLWPAMEPKNGVHCLEQDQWPAMELKNGIHCLEQDRWPAIEPKNGVHCLEQDLWPAMELKNGVHCLEQDLWPAMELKNGVHRLEQDRWPAMVLKNGVHCLEQDRWPALEPKNGFHCLEQDLWPAVGLKSRVHCPKQERWPALEFKNGLPERHLPPTLELRNGVHCLEQDLWPSDAGKTFMTASPRSTLHGLGNFTAPSWRSLSNASSKGSSGVSSRVSSPPSTPVGVQHNTWDLIYAAAEEAVRLRMLEEARAATACFPVRGGMCSSLGGSLPGLSQLPPPACGQTFGAHMPLLGHSKAVQGRNSDFCAVSSPSNAIAAYLHECNLQHTLSSKPEPENRMQLIPGLASRWSCQAKPLQQHASASCSNKQKVGNAHCGYWIPDSPSIPWTPSQPTQSGMRAFFLGSNRSGSESTGTGVFLPRRAGSRPDARKPSMSTVLLPLRVVQALKLNVEDMHSVAVESYTSPHGFSRTKDTMYSPLSPPISNVPRATLQPKSRETSRAGVIDYESRAMHLSQPPLYKVDSESSLPSEWIYY